MIPIGILILSLLVLYFSKNKLSIELGRLIHKIGGDQRFLIILWSIVFLPGTVIHELSHFLFAVLTSARTGKIEIFPNFLENNFENEDSESGSVTLGYVQTQRLNPIQGFLVGTAPLLVGLALLVWFADLIQKYFYTGDYLFVFLIGYLFFTISNSFFPSAADIKQVIPFVVIVSIFLVIGSLVGIGTFPEPSQELITFVNSLSFVIFISVLLNTTLTILIWYFRKQVKRHR